MCACRCVCRSVCKFVCADGGLCLATKKKKNSTVYSISTVAMVGQRDIVMHASLLEISHLYLSLHLWTSAWCTGFFCYKIRSVWLLKPHMISFS